MSVVSAQTRKQLRQSIGDRLGAMVLSTTTQAGNSNGTTFIDEELSGGDGYINGRSFVSGSTFTAVAGYDAALQEGTLRTPAVTAPIATATEYELWEAHPVMRPERIHRFINSAIRTVTKRGAPSAEDYSIHTSRRAGRYDLPAATAMTGVAAVYYRQTYGHVLIDNCDGVWSELVDADVTASADDEVVYEGSASNKFVLGAGLGVNDLIATEDVGTLDLSAMTHIEFWVRADVATTADTFDLILSSAASGATEVANIDVPALSANTWTRVRVALPTPEDCTAIVSVALQYAAATTGLGTVWIDGIEATREDSETWEFVHRNYWSVNKSGRQLVFNAEGRRVVGHSMLYLDGVKKPTELSAETDSCDIDPEYIVAKATALAMRASADRYGSNRDAAHVDADAQEALAFRRLREMQTRDGVRWIDG